MKIMMMIIMYFKMEINIQVSHNSNNIIQVSDKVDTRYNYNNRTRINHWLEYCMNSI